MRVPVRLLVAFVLALALPAPILSCAAQDGSGGGGPDGAADAPFSGEAEAVRKAREAEARARAALEEARAAVRRAEEDALRSRRRDLERSIGAAESDLEAARAAADPAGAREAEARLRVLYRGLASVAAELAGLPPPAGAAAGILPLPRKSTPYAPDAGLPPLVPRAGNRAGPAALAALDWLARHQSRTGNWDADGFDAACTGERCPGAGGPLYDPGVTGLAALAFLGAGVTHRSPAHGEVVRSAMKYLKSIQDAEGCYGPRTGSHFTYNHAVATLAMAEAYGATQSPLFRGSAENGVDFILRAQNPYLGWRYGVRPGDNDTSVTGWMVVALAGARGAGLSVPEEAFTGAVAWLDKVTEPEHGRAGYTARGNGPARAQELLDAFPPARSESLTAEAVLVRLLCGQGRDHEMVRKGASLLLRTTPKWDRTAGTIDLYYWFLGTEALRRLGGGADRAWREDLERAILPAQRGEEAGCARGSLDPVDPWGPDGGRVYSTAVAALLYEALER